MSLKIIYGKSGTGKSTYIFNEIAEKIKKGNRKIYIITPEQFSFTAEKKLLDSINTNSVVLAEVLTFNRMAYRVIKETGNSNLKNLSQTGKSMLIYSNLSKEKNNLNFIGKSLENVNLVEAQITEFKKHGITVEKLEQTIENLEDKYLKSKLKDMLLVYKDYTETIDKKYIDENDNLSMLIDRIDFIRDFDNVDIYIDEFVGFTYQEYEIIKKLLLKANEVNITICTDDININQNQDTDIFYSNKSTIDKLYFIARSENVKIEKPVELDICYRFKNDELKHLEENIYAFPYTKYNKEINNINLFLAKNQYSEIEHIAQNIVKLARDNNYRYNEISVITKNLDEYSNLCKIIFTKYSIPVFIDEKKDFSQNILVKYILSLINVFAKNWSEESVIEYIKSGLIKDVDDDDIYVLENYALRWGIKGSKWYTKELTFYNETEEEQTKILHICEKVIKPLLQLKDGLMNTKSYKNITEKLYEFLVENEINIKISDEINKLEEAGELEKAREYEASYKKIIELLDEIVLIFGEEKVSFEKYAEILKTGLGSSSLGKIPATQDQVIVGDVDRSRSHKTKAVFIIGLNDGIFPSINKDEGYFNDKDREELKKLGAELAKGTIEKLYDDNFNIYKAFSTAEEKVFLSYVSSDLEGRGLRPSILINRVKKIFTNIKEESDIILSQNEIVTELNTFEGLLKNLEAFRDGEEIDEKWFEIYNYYMSKPEWKEKLESNLKALNYNINTDNIKKDILERLYSNTLKTSISRLEQYKSCPFSYYLKYGLNLSERQEFKVQAMDTGTFMHDIIDSFFDKLQERKLNVKTIEEAEEEIIIDEIIEEKLKLKKNYIFTGIPKYIVLANRLKAVVKKSIKYIVYSLKYSDFEVMGHEVEFKNGKEYPAIQVKLDNGKKVEITGKIDRIDIAKTEDGNYIRIIDYKSSAKDINLNEVIAGLQLQLLTYLDAVCNIEDVMPAGVLYFNLINPIIKENKNVDEEKLEEEIRKQFKMKGLILANVDIVKKMDKTLDSGSSNIIPAYIDKEGNLSKKSNAITKSGFENLQKYMNKILKQISEEILTGNISIKPYYKIKQGKTPCEYCKYKSICNFNSGICKKEYNYIGNEEKEYILEQIKEEKEG